MTAKELRAKYLEFFKEKGHAIIPSASLIPENDPTVLFTTAGMHPLVPYLLGEKHPAGKRLADVQKCIRTGDIDEVGDDVHLTFFEMLGNWSLGDPDAKDGIGAGYWKKEAISWSFEFLTDNKWLGIPKEKLAVTVFEGDGDAPFDQISFDTWRGLGVPEKRIAKLGKKDNWWGPAGKTGPCGPDSEMFYWTGPAPVPEIFDPEDKRWVEIWNDVFMEYNKTEDGKFVPLSQKNVDTGMGVERTTAVLNGFNNVFDTDVFKPVILKIEEISGKKYAGNEKPMRIIADHIKAAVFMLAAGVEPGNVERGYVLRRLLRRAIRYGKQLGITRDFTAEIASVVSDIYTDIYPELKKNGAFINEQLVLEEEKFVKTLEKGLKEFEKMKPKFTPLLSKSGSTEYGVSGDDLFNLYSTYGFPVELSLEEIKKMYEEFNAKTPGGMAELSKEDEERFLEQFHKSLKKHQEISRTATTGVFKSGLADNSEQVIKYHTATHLLLAALRKILGPHVFQKGSNITAERMRLDFSHPEKVTPEQIKQVEELVNRAIKEDLPVKVEEMSLEDAKKQGAMGVFDSKYGENVKVYSVGPSASSGEVFSKEICAGPHVEKAGILGEFKIIKEEASSAGVRRIKAILE